MYTTQVVEHDILPLQAFEHVIEGTPKERRDVLLGFRIVGPVQLVSLYIGGHLVWTDRYDGIASRFVVPLGKDIPLWRLAYHEVKLRTSSDSTHGTIRLELLFDSMPSSRRLAEPSIGVLKPVGTWIHSPDVLYFYSGMAFPESSGEHTGPTSAARFLCDRSAPENSVRT